MEFDSPYAPPRSNVVATNDHGWDGKYFRLRNPGVMPRWCLQCGVDDASVEKSVKLRWVNPFTYLWIFVSPVVLMIAYLIVVKRVPVTYHHCVDCAGRQARWKAIMWGAIASFGLALVGCFALERGSEVVGVLAVVCFASLFAIIVAMAMQAPSMAILKHSNGVFYVGRMKRAFKVRLGA